MEHLLAGYFHGLFQLDEFASFPDLVKKRDFCAVETHDRHEVAALDRLDPVGLRCIIWFVRTKINID